MKERPILFSGEMVRAILDGRKMQTRRIVKSAPNGAEKFIDEEDTRGNEFFMALGEEERNLRPILGSVTCPYGQAGNRLWVRETWQAWKEYDKTKANDLPADMKARINYPANGNAWDARIRPSIHMPRWASRILLEIAGVRVERLNDISGEDAFSEGIKIPVAESSGLPLLRLTGKIPPSKFSGKHPNEWNLNEYARFEYANLWESLNGSGSWETNPWVWVISFNVVEVKG